MLVESQFIFGLQSFIDELQHLEIRLIAQKLQNPSDTLIKFLQSLHSKLISPNNLPFISLPISPLPSLIEQHLHLNKKMQQNNPLIKPNLKMTTLSLPSRTFSDHIANLIADCYGEGIFVILAEFYYGLDLCGLDAELGDFLHAESAELD